MVTYQPLYKRREAVAQVMDSVELLQKAGLDAHHAWVFCGIARHLTYSGTASVSIARLAKETLLSERRVIAKIGDLVRAGFLMREKLPRAVNRYRLLPAAAQ
jgi:predicted DNA-binding transcriptional regulator